MRCKLTSNGLKTGLQNNKKASVPWKRRNHFLVPEISSNRGWHGYRGISINFICCTGAFHSQLQGSKIGVFDFLTSKALDDGTMIGRN